MLISQGLLEFRELASKVTNVSRGFTPSVKQIMVTPGANAQIFYAILSWLIKMKKL